MKRHSADSTNRSLAAFEKLQHIPLETQIADTTQFWFSASAINEIAKSNHDTLRALNKTPTFWITVRVGLEYQGIISAGKIFGSRKANPHNIDSFFQVLRECYSKVFAPAALEARKRQGIVRLIRLDPKNLQSRTIRLQVDATRPGRRLGLV